MAALSASRNTQYRALRKKVSIPLKAGAKVYRGGLVAVDSTGHGIAGDTAATLQLVLMANADADNTSGSDGTLSVDCLVCEAYLDNSGSDAVVAADLGKTVYLVDDHTVSHTNASSTESAAGVCTGLDSGGVWVSLGASI